MIEAGKTYTLNGSDIYRAEEMEKPLRGLFLRNLNRSKTWRGVGQTIPQGYAEGYLVRGDRLSHFGYDFEGSHYRDWGTPTPTGRGVAELTPCGMETIVIDMGRWSPECQ